MAERTMEVTIIGGGFAGLSAGYDLARAGHKVTLLEADNFVGGLAGAFEGEGERLDRFYHHWFTSDQEVMGLIDDLGLSDEVVVNPTNTGVYYNKSIFRLSTPLDLLRFSPLPFIDRIRLGLLTLRARGVSDWMKLEKKTAADWLRELGGNKVFKIVWEPLLQGKFGPYAEKVSAVWFWNKLKLRGGSRGKAGEEMLAYFKGSFARLAEAAAEAIGSHGGDVRVDSPVTRITPLEGNRWAVDTPDGRVESDLVIATPALPLIADMVKGWAEPDYVRQLQRIDYLGNVCLVLELDRSLSSTYWLNVNDPSFPYVGVIEHTNFESPESYGGKHVIYLSKYLPHTDALYEMTPDEVMQFSIPHLKKMFPEFEEDWIHRYHVWKARWSQPVVEKDYSRLIPSEEGPLPGLFVCSMAQIYPEDRGTNYAIREGRKLARKLTGKAAG